MLPNDTKARREDIKVKLQQSQVNEHFPSIPPEEQPKPYTDELFQEAAVQWLIETDQVYSIISFHIN